MKNFLAAIPSFIDSKSNRFLMGALVLTTLLAFGPFFLGQEFLTYDDNWYIYENKNVINFSWDALVNIFSAPNSGQYSPIGEVFNGVLYSIFGKNATAFKLAALLIHILNATLVYTVFRKLFEDKKLAFFVAMLFAIHPQQVELIAWASAIYRIAALFMLVGIYFYLNYLRSQKKTHLLVVFVCYVLALFTKEQAVLFPIALLFVNLIKRRFLFQKRIIFENLVLGLLAIAYVLFTFKVVTAKNDFESTEYTLLEKCSLFAKAVVNYFQNFIWPTDLSFSYPAAKVVNFASSGLMMNIVLLTALLAAGIFFASKSKHFLIGHVWVIGFLSIALSFPFFSIRDVFMADRYVYFALIGMAFCLFQVLKWAVATIKGSQNIVYALTGAYLILLFGLCFNRVRAFENSRTIWADAIEQNPNNYLALNSLGYYFRSTGRNERALDYYKQSIAVNDAYHLSQSNIGKVYFEEGNYKEALKHVSKAIALQPNYKTAYKNRAAIFLKTKQWDLLIKELDKLMTYFPDDPLYLKEKASAYFQLKDYGKAIATAKSLETRDGQNAFAHYMQGHGHLMLKKYEEASTYLDRAIAIDQSNGDYHFVRSIARFRTNRVKEAYEDAKKAQSLGYQVNAAYMQLIGQQMNKKSIKN
ncbi:MAG: tetratricopeptide repeat protein [Croceitalea sp.]|nr:tetratricopeptide repeat protein [Croceitalea sp.]